MLKAFLTCTCAAILFGWNLQAEELVEVNITCEQEGIVVDQETSSAEVEVQIEKQELQETSHCESSCNQIDLSMDEGDEDDDDDEECLNLKRLA